MENLFPFSHLFTQINEKRDAFAYQIDCFKSTHSSISFRPLNMGRNFVFGCAVVFFIFHKKSSTLNKHRNRLSDIPY